MSIDAFLTGEAAQDRDGVVKAPLNGDRDLIGVSGFTFGYNRSLFAKRVHDVLTAIAFVVENALWDAKKLHLVSLDEEGSLLALAARTQCGEEPKLGKTVAMIGQAEFAKVREMDDPRFVPGAEKYGDVRGLIALCAPAPVMVVGETLAKATMSPAIEAYLAHDAAKHLEVRSKVDGAEVMRWLGE